MNGHLKLRGTCGGEYSMRELPFSSYTPAVRGDADRGAMPACLVTIVAAFVLYSLLSPTFSHPREYGPSRHYYATSGLGAGISSMLSSVSARAADTTRKKRARHENPNDKDFKKLLKTLPEGCLVVFTAEWCPHCKDLKSKADQIAAETKLGMAIFCDTANLTDEFMHELAIKYFPFVTKKVADSVQITSLEEHKKKGEADEPPQNDGVSGKLSSFLPTRKKGRDTPAANNSLDAAAAAAAAAPFDGLFA